MYRLNYTHKLLQIIFPHYTRCLTSNENVLVTNYSTAACSKKLSSILQFSSNLQISFLIFSKARDQIPSYLGSYSVSSTKGVQAVPSQCVNLVGFRLPAHRRLFPAGRVAKRQGQLRDIPDRQLATHAGIRQRGQCWIYT